MNSARSFAPTSNLFLLEMHRTSCARSITRWQAARGQPAAFRSQGSRHAIDRIDSASMNALQALAGQLFSRGTHGAIPPQTPHVGDAGRRAILRIHVRKIA